MDLKERYERAKQLGEPFVLTEEDLALGIDPNNDQKEIKTIEDLVMVHATDYLPKGAIRTSSSTGRRDTHLQKFTLYGKDSIELEYDSNVYRDTNHFCLNSAPGSHEYRYGTRRYVVIMPLASNKDKIVAGNECDLWSEGDVELKDDAFILCPEDEMAAVKDANPGVTIIGFKGTEADPYANIFLSRVLGYKSEEPENKNGNWSSVTDRNIARNIIESNGWPFSSHNSSVWFYQEIRDSLISKLYELTKKIIEKKLLMDNNIFSEEAIEIRRTLSNIISLILSNNKKCAEKNKYSNEEMFKIISEKLSDLFGVEADFTNVVLESHSKDYDEAKFGQPVVDLLRRKALEEKSEQGTLSESEKIELLFYQNVGSFYEFENASNLPKEKKKEIIDKYIKTGIIRSKEEYETVIASINKVDSLENKNIDELDDEEKQCLITCANFQLKLSKMTYLLLKNDFSLEYKGFLESNDKNIVIPSCGLSASDFSLNCAACKTEEELINYSKSILEFEGSHLTVNSSYFEFANIPVVKTDFDISQFKTVKELMTAVYKYSYNFRELYTNNGPQFDSKGNIVEEMDKNKEFGL